MKSQSYADYLKSVSTVKAFAFALLCFGLAVHFTVVNWTLLVTNPNYVLPVLSIIIAVIVGIKNKTVTPIVIGSVMGVLLTIALPELMSIASQNTL